MDFVSDQLISGRRFRTLNMSTNTSRPLAGAQVAASSTRRDARPAGDDRQAGSNALDQWAKA
jgi:hypothetical protein